MVLFLLSTSAFATEISKKDWLNSMSTVLPTYLCQESQYFRQCFDITQKECEKVALSATRICLEKEKSNIPVILNQPKDGEYWGTIIGACVGESYEITLIKKKKDNPKCNDPKYWTK